MLQIFLWKRILCSVFLKWCEHLALRPWSESRSHKTYLYIWLYMCIYDSGEHTHSHPLITFHGATWMTQSAHRFWSTSTTNEWLEKITDNTMMIYKQSIILSCFNVNFRVSNFQKETPQSWAQHSTRLIYYFKVKSRFLLSGKLSISTMIHTTWRT